MATAPAPERPNKAKIRVRRSIVSKGKAGSFRPSSSRNTGSSGSSPIQKPSQSSPLADPESAQDAMQPDFLDQAGAEGGDSWQPDGWDGDNSDYDSDNPSSKADVDDKDKSNAQESGVNDQGGVGNDPYGPNLAEAEKNPNTNDGQDTSGNLNREGFANDPDKSAWENATRQAGRNAGIKIKNRGFRSKKGVFAIVGTIGITLTIFGAIVSVPNLAIQIFKDRLVATYSAPAKLFVKERFNRFVGTYVTEKIVPSLAQNNCNSVLQRGCNKVNPTTGTAVTRAVQNWNQNRIEERLFRNQGLEIKKFRGENRYQVLQNGRVLGEGGSRELVRLTPDFVESDSKWRQILDRKDFRSVASFSGADKYCLFACSKRDRFEDIRISGVRKIQMRVITRVVSPASAKAGAALFCMVEGCSPARLADDASKAAKEVIANADEAFLAAAKNIGDKRVSQYVVEKAVDAIFDKAFKGFAGRVSGQTVAKSVPIAGWIYAVATIIDITDRADEFLASGGLEDFVFDRNAAAASEAAIIALSGADDAIAIEDSPPLDELGGFYQYISGFNQSRIYQKSSGSQLGSITCSDGSVISGDSPELICPDERLRQNLIIDDFYNLPGVGLVRDLAFGSWRECILTVPTGGFLPTPDIPFCPETREIIRPVLRGVNFIAGVAGQAVVGALSALPPFAAARDFATNKFSEFSTGFVDWAFPLAVKQIDKGARYIFDASAQGLDYLYTLMVRGYEDESGAMQGMGGKLLSPEELVDQNIRIAEMETEELENQSLYARYFDLQNPRSVFASTLFRFGSTLPLTKPLSFDFGISTLFTNPLGNKASAFVGESVRSESVSGIKQYGVSAETLARDPQSNTPEFCAERTKLREASRTEDGDYTIDHPCILDDFVADLATQVDNLDPEGSVPDSGSGTTGENISEYIDGTIIPCQGDSKIESEFFGPGQNAINWENVASSMGGPSGVIGQDTNGRDMMVFVRDACGGQGDVRTVVIASSIHGSENGGQRVSFELLFNSDLPDDVRIITIPEVNKSGIAGSSRNNPNGVNLNRNFDFNWAGNGDNVRGSGNYRGPSPASEAETQNVQNFMTALGPTNLFMAYHDCINKVFYSGERSYAQSRPIAEAYVGKFNGGTASCNNKSWPWTSAPNRGGGFMEAWYANATGSPALLVELNNSESAEYMKAHANIVKELLEEGIIK